MRGSGVGARDAISGRDKFMSIAFHSRSVVEARRSEHGRLRTPNQRRKTSINHPTSMFQLLVYYLRQTSLTTNYCYYDGW